MQAISTWLHSLPIETAALIGWTIGNVLRIFGPFFVQWTKGLVKFKDFETKYLAPAVWSQFSGIGLSFGGVRPLLDQYGINPDWRWVPVLVLLIMFGGGYLGTDAFREWLRKPSGGGDGK